MSKTNPRLEGLIADLKSASRNGGGDVWADIADRLEKPRRAHAEVNLGRIERYAREDETGEDGAVIREGAIRVASIEDRVSSFEGRGARF